MSRLTVVVLAMLLPSLVLGQSLGDAARKEKERRQKNEEAGVKTRVVTEDELLSGDGQLANDPDEEGMYEPAPDGSLARGAVSKADKAGVQRQSDETSWRDRKARAVARAESARKKHEMYSEMWLAPAGEYYVNRKTGKRIDSVGELQKLTAAAKAELDAAQKALDDLEERARRANVPPGWLR